MEVQESIEMESLGATNEDNPRSVSQSTEIKPLPIWKLFQSATCLDVVLIIFASILSTVAGLCMPGVIFIIGYVITEFSNFIIAELVSSSPLNNSTFSSSSMNISTLFEFCDNTTTTFTGYLDYLNSANPGSRLRTELYFYACILLGIALGYMISLSMSSFLWSVVAFQREKLMKKKLVESALRQDQAYYDVHHNATDISDLLLEHVKNASSIVTQSCGEMIEQLSSALCSLVIALIVDWSLALVVGSMTVALFIMLAIFGKLGIYGLDQVQSHLNIAASFAEQILLSIKTVMAYGGKEKEAKRYRTLLSHTWIYSIVKSISYSIVFSFYVLLIFGAFSLGFWYGTDLYVMCTGITVGDIVLVIVLITQLNNSIGYTIVPLDNLNKASISGAYIFNFINEEPTIMVKDDSNKLTLDSITGEVRITDVVFSYPSRPSATILHKVNLHILPGQTVALVGPSGCGKSTLLSLITRVYDVTKGSILLDGYNVRDFSVRWLKDQIGIVSQQPILFNVSIAENIRYGMEAATMEEIQTAAEIANIHDYIDQLPDGYDTVVGEGGSLISGGQKQRIAIARALVKNPKLLLLDEATSALDVKSERLVQQALDKAREGRTTIIIAHRLSTIMNADVIVAMDKGHVVEMGTHRELMENEGLYHKLVVTKSAQEDESNDHDKGFRRALGKSKRSMKRSTIRRSASHYNRSRRRRSSIGSSVRRSSEPERRRSSNALRPLSVQPLEISPMEEIDGETLRKPKYTNLLSLVKPDWGILALGIIFYALSGIQQSSVYILMSQALDVYTQSDATAIKNDVLLYVYLFVGIGLFGGVLYFLGTLALEIGARRSSNRIRIQLFESLLSQDASFFDEEENTVSTLLTHLTEGPEYIAEVCGIPIGFVVRIIFVGFASIVVSFYASWALSLILLPSFIVIVGSWWLDNFIGDIFAERINDFLEDSNNTAVEAIEHVDAVNAIGIGEKISVKFIKTFSDSSKYVLYKSAIHACFYSIAKTSVIFVTSAAIATSGHIFLLDSSNSTHASFNNIVLAIVSVLFTGVILKDAFTSLVHLQNAKIAASEINARLKWPKATTNSNSGQVLKSFTADVSANSIYFSYPSAPAPSILNSLTFTVKEGQSLAFVGPSGSGKSTIISLIEKFYPNLDSGTLNIGGKDIGTLDTKWLREQIGLVSQEPVLFDVSIADNIRYGSNHREVSDEEIHEAAKSANIHEFIISLSEGYNTLVGLRGAQISGGQKQRIAIARALVRKPKILLLDEATSALDAESERHVQEALDRAREGRTTIIIAHRLSTIQNADCIAVLHKGRIIEQGTHAELMEKKGAYYIMMNEQ